jgi:hypothetical protein
MLSARSAEIADQLNLSFTAIPAKLAGLEARGISPASRQQVIAP